MSVSKRALLATIAGVAMALSTVAMAQTPGSKSNPVTTIGEGEAVMIHPKTHVVHKSKLRFRPPSTPPPWRSAPGKFPVAP